MTNTEIAQLGERIMASYGMSTHVVVLSPEPEPTEDQLARAVQHLRSRYCDGLRIARMWREEIADAPTMGMEIAR